MKILLPPAGLGGGIGRPSAVRVGAAKGLWRVLGTGGTGGGPLGEGAT